MRSKLSLLALCAALACSNAFAQDAAPQSAPAESAAPAAAVSTVAAPAADVAEAPVADATPAPVAAPAAAAAAPAVAGKVGAPPEGKGQIVFFREKKFTGGAIGFKVREGETELGKLSNGTYFILPVEPGTHEYAVHSEAKDVLTLEVEAGETYYVSSAITMGFLVGRPNLSPSDQTAFDKVSAKLKLVR